MNLKARVLVGVGSLACLGVLSGSVLLMDPGAQVASTLRDFYGPGTQPGSLEEPMWLAADCAMCHGGYDEHVEPYTRWAASMMGQGARDPIYWAAMAVAEQAAPNVSNFCNRCHAPMGWADPSAGMVAEGISCSMCHRMVDPVYKPGISPEIDKDILGALADRPRETHSAHAVIDSFERRRGPFALEPGFPWHRWQQSPFHLDSRMCATCHDVTNPLFTMDSSGAYVLNPLDEPHPTHMPYDGFPLERTYSEWSRSEFAQGPIEMGGRFGGNLTAVSSCQDCHMPKTTGTACLPGLGGIERSDLPQHDFRGATTWMLRAVRNLYPDGDTGLSGQSVADAVERNTDMLGRAADLFVARSGDQAVVRVVNQTGHKLPTGHLEGRRMWLNVRFLDAGGVLIAERGGYDLATATLHPEGTKVYEAIVGLDDTMAAELGVPAGPSHLFPLNNKFYLDNRIPPRGFRNTAFKEVQCAPVGYAYHDLQYWDNTRYAIPAGTARVEARLYYQTITREAVEGLREANTTTEHGEILYEQWLANDKGPPVLMALAALDLATACRADFTGDGGLNTLDLMAVLNAVAARDPRADLDDDGRVNSADLVAYLALFQAGCP